MSPRIAIVSRDDDVRAAAARAFGTSPGEWSLQLCDDDPGDADVVVRGSDVPADGAIVFDPEHPDDALRAVHAACAGAASRTYVVAGAAGGVGATTIALHLAAALGSDTCYAELTGPSARLGLPESARTWLPRDEDVSSSALPVEGGFRVLRAPSPLPAPGAFPLGAARDAFARLVLDVGARGDLAAVLSGADAALVVTTPTRPAALAARALADELPGVSWTVVVNRVGPGGQLMRTALEQHVGREIAIELPCCPALRDAEDEARLLTGTWRRWTRGIARLARALESC
jgi:hypothetical protein